MKNQTIIISILIFLSIAVRSVNGIMAGSIMSFFIFLITILLIVDLVKSFSKKRKEQTQDSLIRIMINILLIMSTVAIYFKLMFFPKADTLILLSLTGLILCIPFYFIKHIKSLDPVKEKKTLSLVYLALIILLTILPSNYLDKIHKEDLKKMKDGDVITSSKM